MAEETLLLLSTGSSKISIKWKFLSSFKTVNCSLWLITCFKEFPFSASWFSYRTAINWNQMWLEHIEIHLNLHTMPVNMVGNNAKFIWFVVNELRQWVPKYPSVYFFFLLLCNIWIHLSSLFFFSQLCRLCCIICDCWTGKEKEA